MKRICCILPCLMLLGLMLLAGCMTSPRSGQPAEQATSQPDASLAKVKAAVAETSTPTATDLARIDAGAAWLDTSLAKITAAVAEAKQQSPGTATAITARVEPVVQALQKAVATYGAAAAVGDVPKAEATWPDARKAVSTAVEVGIKVLGPKLLTLLGV